MKLLLIVDATTAGAASYSPMEIFESNTSYSIRLNMLIIKQKLEMIKNIG